MSRQLSYRLRLLTERPSSFQFVEGSANMGQICLDLAGDVAQIGHRVHDLHRLRERVVTNFVRPLNVLRHPASKVQIVRSFHQCLKMKICPDAPEFVKSVLQTFGHKVNVLIVLILVRLHRAGVGLVGQQLRFSGQRMYQLAVTGQQTSAESPQLAVLFAQAELDGEPVHLIPH